MYRNLLKKSIYAVFIYPWCTNLTIKVDENAKCSKKKGIRHTGNLNAKRKETMRIETVDPFHRLRIRTNFLLPLLPPTLYFLPSFSQCASTSLKTVYPSGQGQIPDHSKRDIHQPSQHNPHLRIYPITLAHRLSDKGAAGHFPSALPQWCASSGMFRIPTVLARCRALRIYGKTLA